MITSATMSQRSSRGAVREPQCSYDSSMREHGDQPVDQRGAADRRDQQKDHVEAEQREQQPLPTGRHSPLRGLRLRFVRPVAGQVEEHLWPPLWLQNARAAGLDYPLQGAGHVFTDGTTTETIDRLGASEAPEA